MADDLIKYDDWMKRTGMMGKPRSKLLKELDEELKRYERFGGSQAQWAVGQKLAAWKASKGPGEIWKHNARNRKGRAFEELTALLAGKGDTDKAVSPFPDFMHPDLVNARLGVVYLFGNMGVESNLFNVLLEGGLDATGSILKFGGAEGAATNLKTVMVPGKAILDATETGAHTARANSPEAASLLQKVKRWLAAFASKVWRALAEKFGDIGPLASSIKNLVNVLAGVFLKKAAPFIGAGMDIAKGAVNTIDSSMVLFKSWLRGRGVDIAQGHPATIVASITRAMKLSLFEGLYQMLKGAGAAAMAGASAGATVIVDLLIALAETLVKLIWRIVEITRMDRFFQQAGEFWRNREASTAIHKHPIEFGRWYKKTALNLPAISILTLNSGICGDKMRFLQMFKADGTQISQGEFDRGVRFVDGLKPWGAEYLGKCGYSFQASSKFVSGLLDFSAEHAKQRNKAWAITRKIANA